MAKIGRPSKYSKKLARKILAELSEGYSLRTVCSGEDMPCIATIFGWFDKHPEFLKQYKIAKQEGVEAMVDEMIDIADNGENDWMTKHNKDGSESWIYNGEHVQRSRLRVDTRKWIASKLKPRKYGDKLDLTTDGKALPTPIYGGKSTEQ